MIIVCKILSIIIGAIVIVLLGTHFSITLWNKGLENKKYMYMGYITYVITLIGLLYWIIIGIKH